MTDSQPRASRLRSVLPAVLLLGVLAGAMALPGDDLDGRLQLADPVSDAAGDLRAVFRDLEPDQIVLVGFDPDLGTYAEIRPAVRAALDDLLQRRARLAFLSLSPEGRALAVAELARLGGAGIGPDRLADLGFVAGVEAGLVRAIDAPVPTDSDGEVAEALRSGGMSAASLVLVVAGADVGPRTWVEQVGPRLPALPMTAIAPTFLQPELGPYLRSGQLVALVASVRDAAGLVEIVREGPVPPADTSNGDRPPDGAAMLIGLAIALAVLIEALLGRGLRGLRGSPS